MPESTGPLTSQAPGDAPAHALLVVIVPSGVLFEAVLTSLLARGLSGTVLDGKGLMAVMREEMPIFGGLASMLPNSAGTRILLVATTRSLAREAIAMLQSEFKPSDRPIAVVIGVTDAVGIRH